MLRIGFGAKTGVGNATVPAGTIDPPQSYADCAAVFMMFFPHQAEINLSAKGMTHFHVPGGDPAAYYSAMSGANCYGINLSGNPLLNVDEILAQANASGINSLNLNIYGDLAPTLNAGGVHAYCEYEIPDASGFSPGDYGSFGDALFYFVIDGEGSGSGSAVAISSGASASDVASALAAALTGATGMGASGSHITWEATSYYDGDAPILTLTGSILAIAVRGEAQYNSDLKQLVEEKSWNVTTG